MRMFLNRLATPLVRNNAKLRANMAKILPYFTYGQEKILDALVSHFLPFLCFKVRVLPRIGLGGLTSDFQELDAGKLEDEARVRYNLDCFINVVQSIPPRDPNGQKVPLPPPRNNLDSHPPNPNSLSPPPPPPRPL
jgi:hypothetical protein